MAYRSISTSRLRSVTLLLVAAVLVPSAGCSTSLESEVAGTVTLDGQPVGPGVVNFSPVDGEHNPAIGTVRPNGSYFLKTSRTEGLPAGKYRVAVSVFEQPAGVEPGARNMAAPKLLTPEKYDSVETSGLEFNVDPGRNTIDIPLVSSGSVDRAP